VRAVAAIPAVSLLVGSALGLFVPDIPAPVGIGVLLAATIASVCAWRLQSSAALGMSVAVGFFAGSALLAADAWREAWRPSLRVAFEELARAERAQAAAEHRSAPEDDEAFAILEGVLRTDGDLTPSGASVSIAVETICSATLCDPPRCGATLSGSRSCRAVTGGVAATVVGSLAADRVHLWRTGRRVRVPIQLRRASRYLDPGVPDHERALARRGTILVGTIKSAALVDVVSKAGALDETIGAIRAFSRRAIADAVGRWSERSAAIVSAIVIGDRAGLDDDVQRALQEAGTYHVIAISGGNIAILAGLLLGAFRFAGLLGRTATLAAIVILLAYADFVGGGASVDRATLMAVVYFAGRAVDQRSPPINTLALVAALIVAASPLSIADPAFVLTFGATLAIVVVMPVVAATQAADDGSGVAAPSALTRFAGAGRAMFAASVAAEAMLFPVGAIVFSRITFAGLGLNFLAIPLMGVAQLAGMAVVPAALVSARAAAAAGFLAHCGAAGLVWSASLVRLAPMLAYRVAAPAWPGVVAYYAGLTVVWVLWRRRTITGTAETRGAKWTRVGAAAIAAGAAVWILAEPWTLIASRGDGRLRVTFIDVGQGDAAFVRFPHGATLLVDAGGLAFGSAFDIGDRVVAPVVRSAGVRRLDAFGLTHGDPDHIGGAGAILREFRPHEIWEGIPVPRFEPLSTLKDAARNLGLAWRNVHTTDRIVLDDVEIVVRNPPPADWERQRVRNDDSIVLEMRWRDVSLLFTGDIGRTVERSLSLAPRARLRIVKVAHHGSLTSSAVEFVTALAPQVAVVSCGRANHFGHPAPEVLQRYRDVGSEIFRTDQDGAVMVDTDGYSIEARSYTGRSVAVR
jgi:competence protein ComEC